MLNYGIQFVRLVDTGETLMETSGLPKVIFFDLIRVICYGRRRTNICSFEAIDLNQ